MARLPLLCKGCLQPLQVPEPDPEPEPPPPFLHPTQPQPARPHQADVPGKVEIATGANSTGGNPVSTDTASSRQQPDVLVAQSDSSSHIDFDIPGPTVANFNDPKKLWPQPTAPAAPAPAPTAPAPVPRAGTGKLIALVVDVAVGLILLVAGVFVGELLARKSTREVLTEAGSAAKFPPLELIQWLGPPLFFGLIYMLFVSRGWSIGGWLKRRRG